MLCLYTKSMYRLLLLRSGELVMMVVMVPMMMRRPVEVAHRLGRCGRYDTSQQNKNHQ